MIQLSYTRSPLLLKKIDAIEELRKNLLSFPLSWKDERYMQWKTSIDRIQHVLQLENILVPRRTLETIFSFQTDRKLEVSEQLAFDLKGVYENLYFDWHVQPFTITEESIKKVLQTFKSFKLENTTEFSQNLVYIQTNPDHPIIQAALAEIAVMKSQMTAPYMMILGSIIRTMFLYKNGYDWKRLISLSGYYHQNRSNYQTIQAQSIKEKNATAWIEFVVEGYNHILTSKLEELQNHTLSDDPHYAEFKAHLAFTDRQKKILAYLDRPASQISNRQVQKLCKVSAITAARDLAKLTAVGQIFPVGKGRSTYYAKV